jgi:hypothetical protein
MEEKEDRKRKKRRKEIKIRHLDPGKPFGPDPLKAHGPPQGITEPVQPSSLLPR